MSQEGEGAKLVFADYKLKRFPLPVSQLSGVKLRMSVWEQKLSDGAGSSQSICLGWLACLAGTPNLQMYHFSVLSKYSGFLQNKRIKSNSKSQVILTKEESPESGRAGPPCVLTKVASQKHLAKDGDLESGCSGLSCSDSGVPP